MHQKKNILHGEIKGKDIIIFLRRRKFMIYLKNMDLK